MSTRTPSSISLALRKGKCPDIVGCSGHVSSADFACPFSIHTLSMLVCAACKRGTSVVSVSSSPAMIATPMGVPSRSPGSEPRESPEITHARIVDFPIPPVPANSVGAPKGTRRSHANRARLGFTIDNGSATMERVISLIGPRVPLAGWSIRSARRGSLIRTDKPHHADPRPSPLKNVRGYFRRLFARSRPLSSGLCSSLSGGLPNRLPAI